MAGEWVPAVTAGIAAAAALGGQVISGLIQGRNQERMEARQRRERAAEVLAQVRAFLIDASPDRLGINASKERSPDTLRELQERRAQIRIPLLTLAGGHPSAHVRDLARRLELEMANTLHMGSWFVSDLLAGGSQNARDDANRHFEEALRLLDRLVAAIQEPEMRRRVRGRIRRPRELSGRD